MKHTDVVEPPASCTKIESYELAVLTGCRVHGEGCAVGVGRAQAGALRHVLGVHLLHVQHVAIVLRLHPINHVL